MNGSITCIAVAYQITRPDIDISSEERQQPRYLHRPLRHPKESTVSSTFSSQLWCHRSNRLPNARSARLAFGTPAAYVRHYAKRYSHSRKQSIGWRIDDRRVSRNEGSARTLNNIRYAVHYLFFIWLAPKCSMSTSIPILERPEGTVVFVFVLNIEQIWKWAVLR